MPKLHFKRTPEEDATRIQHKKQKKEERRKRRHAKEGDAVPSSSKRRRVETKPRRKWSSSDDEPGPSTSHKPDYDTILEELEEEMFRDKMFSAMDDEERLDSIEAHFNDFVHVPGRWKRGNGIYTFEVPQGMTCMPDCTLADPYYMDDEEYVEWIRDGMYRLKHADEFAEQQRKKAAYETRKAEEKARKKESARLEKAAEEERKRRKQELEKRRWTCAREYYDQRWSELLTCNSHDHQRSFGDIPWPVIAAYQLSNDPLTTPICLEDLTEGSICMFLLPDSMGTKQKREKLREAMLRFHPDKFEGRIMKLIIERDRPRVREGIAQVVRVLSGVLGSLDK